ncbi:non-ribosomal peptide synthetase [Gordonia rubripertincta]|uniref:Amino acid adenylation domain-containing protein n=1 Tax=Gordonia rubripertincta TaxID=36822 RepID=A0ABT4MSP0_GORRU|nr:non-ribosomal peptide synthetase [Gordonia rubripertincta]MCZ4550028.1 amino acid adenylation domain-containing protein [Gordonia rubripertincta]
MERRLRLSDAPRLSHAQWGIWFAQELAPQSPVFSIGQIAWLPEGADADLLARAVGVAVHDAEVLWTVFEVDDSGPRQLARPPENPPAIAVSMFDGTADALRAQARVRVSEPIPLDGDQLFDTSVWRLTDGRLAWEFRTHHILLDAYAISLLTRRVAQVYTALARGESVPESTFGTVAEMIAAEDDYDSSDVAERDRTYWRDLVESRGHEGRVQVPAAPEPEMPISVSVKLDRDIIDRVDRLAKPLGATWGDAMIALWGWYNAVRNGDTATTIGIPVMARRGAGLLTPMMQVNILPLELEFNPRDRVADVLTRATAGLKDIRRHQRFRGERLVEVTDGVKPALSQINLHVFDYNADFDGVPAVTEALATGPAEDLNLFVYNDPVNGFVLELKADPSRYDEAALRVHLRRIVSAVRELSSLTGDDPLRALSPADHTDLASLTEWASQPAAIPQAPVIGGTSRPAATIDARLQSAAHHHPTRVAVIAGADTRLTYTEFDELVNQVARYLISIGTRTGDRVAVMAGRDEWLPVMLAAVMRAGAVYVPIDPDNPADRIRFLLGDAAPRVVVTNTGRAPEIDAVLADEGIPVVDLADSGTRRAVSELSSAPVLDVDRSRRLVAEDAAYLIYTSGTTGVPKGVVVSHANVIALFDATQHFDFSADDVWILLHSYAFDFSVWEQWAPLTTGATLVVVDQEVVRDPVLIGDAIRRHQVTVLNQTPSAFYALSDVEDARPDTAELALRTVVFGGEALDVTRLSSWLQRHLGGPTLINMYGITETTVHVTEAVVTGDRAARGGSMIGTPLPGLRADVLTPHLQCVPVGVVGELYVAGPQVTRGYRGRAALTATRFIANPNGSGDRMYRTGDLARWTENGELEYLGRIDDQVEIRGFRIEPGEVTAAVQSHPAVTAAAVVPIEQPDSGNLLAAYYCTRAGTDAHGVPLEEALHEWVAAALPAYMVPSVFVRVEALPMTKNGKLDRRALPAIDLAEHAGRGRELLSEDEFAIASVFRDVLGLGPDAPISADDDFFKLGGDSIVSIQAVSHARRVGLVTTAKQVFEQRTVARIAASAMPVAQEPEVFGRDAAEEHGLGASAPLMPIAHRLSAAAGFDSFAQTFVFAGPATVTATQLRGAFERLVDRHPALRARVGERGGELQLEIGSAAHSVTEQLDHHELEDAATSHWGSQRWQHQLTEITATLAHSLDPADGTMWRATWATVEGESTGRLIVVIHHLVVDGVSWRILGDDLAAAMSLEGGDVAAALSTPGTGLLAWSHALTAAARTPALEEQRALWLSMANPSERPLGARHLDPRRDSYEQVRHVTVNASGETSAALLADIPRIVSGTVNDALLGALSAALGIWSSRRDAPTDHGILLGLEGHGREESVVSGSDLSTTVGWFTSWYPVRLPVSADDADDPTMPSPQRLVDAVLAVKETLAAIPDKGIGFGVLRHLSPAPDDVLRSLDHPQVSFNYLGQFSVVDDDVASWRPAPETGGIALHVADEAPAPAIVDITARSIVSDTGVRLVADVAYVHTVIDEDAVQELAELWVEALSALAEHATGPGAVLSHSPSDFPLVNISSAAIREWEDELGELADVHPLTPAQRGVLFHSQLGVGHGGVDLYVAQHIRDVIGPLSQERLQDAWLAVSAKHPQLRVTVRAGNDGTPVAVVPKAMHQPVTVVDLRASDDPDRDLERFADEDRARGFDLEPGAGEGGGRETAALVRLAVALVDDTTSVLVLTSHHAVLDGWSTPLLVQELLRAYRDPESVASRVDDTFQRFARRLAAANDEQAAQTWRAALAAVDEPTLIAGGWQPDDGGFPDTTVASLTAEETAALTTLAGRRGVTLNTVIQAAWAVTLHAHTGSSTAVFGSVVSGRSEDVDGIETAIGMFVNTIPTVVSLTPDMTIGSVLESTHRFNVSVLDCHHTSLTEMHRLSGQSVLFDTLVVMENYVSDDAVLAGLERANGLSVGLRQWRDSTNYPLTLRILPAAELSLELSYYPDGVSAAAAERVLDTVVRTLRAFGSGVDEAVSRLDLVGATDAALLQRISRGPAMQFPDVTVDALLSAAAQEHDGRPAVTFRDVELTYAQFDSTVNRLARLLIATGVRVGDRVVSIAGRDEWLPISTAAIIRAGGVYVPVDPELPAQRRDQMIVDCTPAVIVINSDGHTLRDLPDVHGEVSLVDLRAPSTHDEMAAVSDAPVTDSERSRRLYPEHSVYLMYTSGTTGAPKGVEVNHRALVNRLSWAAAQSGGSQHPVGVAKSGVGFIDALTEILQMITVGGRLVVADDDAAKDPALLAQLCDAFGVTDAVMVPSLARSLASAGATLDSLRRLTLSGEQLDSAVRDQLGSAFPHAAVSNYYGSTEVTGDVTTHAATSADAGPIPIGTPVPNSGVAILDSWLRPSPRGVVGELYASGAQLALGYHAGFALTASRFVADPAGFGNRLYRTGDLARWNAEGVVEYVGRADDQVKIRGRRVEPGEIAAILGTHPEVGEATVVAAAAPDSSIMLVAYYSVARDAQPSVVDGDDRSDAGLDHRLRTWAGARCAPHMVPTVFVRLDAMPLTVNGKLDRKALPAVDLGALSGKGRALAAGTERVVGDLVVEVLGLGDTELSADDDFFALGGHSLVATRLVALLNERCACALTLRSVFDHRTVAALAAAVRTAADNSGPQHLPRPGDVPRTEQIPASSGQQALWAIEALSDSDARYVVPVKWQVTGRFDPSAWERAIELVVRRHEALRTRLVEAGADGLVQVVEPADSVGRWLTTERLDLDGSSTSGGDTHSFWDVIEDWAQSPISLRSDMPIRSLIATAPDRTHIIAVAIHHAFVDEWSMSTIAGELWIAYDAYAEGRQPSLPEITVQYADFALWQHELSRIGALDSDVEYWTETLADAPELSTLPSDRPRPVTPTYEGAHREFVVDDSTTAALQEISAATDASLFVIVHAAVALTLHRMGAGSDLLISSPTAGRESAAVMSTVGYFINTVVFRHRLDPTLTPGAFVQATREMVLEALDHQAVPFDEVVAASRVGRVAGANPLSQVLLNFITEDEQIRDVIPTPAGLSQLEKIGGILRTVKADLEIEFRVVDGRLTGGVSYATELYEAATIDRLVDVFTAALEVIAHDRGRTLGATEFGGHDEHVMIEARIPDGSILSELTVDGMVRSALRERPAGPALVFGERTYSAGEFDAQVNALARHLIFAGVQVGDRVAVLMRRRPELPLAMAAVVRAGAAFVLIDPVHPHERIRYLVEDSAPAAIVTAGPAGDVPAQGGEVVIDLTDPGVTAQLKATDTDTVDDSERSRILHPDDSVYVVYTSGTTGRPKGVDISHRAFGELLRRRQELCELTPGDRVMARTAIGFDPAAAELFWPLIFGGVAHYLDDDEFAVPARIVDLLNRNEFVWIDFTPSLMEELLRQESLSRLSPRVLSLGGETVPLTLVRELHERFGIRAWNIYGPAEATIEIVAGQFDPTAEYRRGRLPIGRPLANTDAVVLDSWLRRVPAGTIGELYVSGVQLARGYHRRPGHSAASFVADPWGNGRRLYRTGDLARWNAEGSLEYLGRDDDQVKIRGQRVEPGEVAAVVAGHEWVGSAAVVAVDHPVSGKTLVGYVTARGEGARLSDVLFVERMRDWVGERIPAHMVPSAFARLDVLPVTANGKVDRNALPAVEVGVPTGRGAELTTDTERVVAEVVATVLGVGDGSEMTAGSDFFALGGHSLLATRVIAELNERCGSALTMRAVFEHPTVAGLGAALDAVLTDTTSSPKGRQLGVADRPDRIPASYGQQALWAIGQATGPSSQYVIGDALRVDDEIDASTLRAAVVSVVRRHEALRTHFAWQADDLLQIIRDPDEAEAIPYEVLEVADDEVATVAGQQLSRPRDGSEAWPVGFVHLRSAGGQWLLVAGHHIVFDETSFDVFLSDLDLALRAERGDRDARGRLSAGEGALRQFADWALRERAVLDTAWGGREALLDRVTTRLADYVVYPYLPYDHHGSGRPPASESAEAECVLPRSLVEQFQEFTAHSRTTPLMLLNAALSAALSSAGAPVRSIYGTPATLREGPDEQQSIGYHLNTVPVPVSTEPASSFGENVSQARRLMLESLDTRDMPFEFVASSPSLRVSADSSSPVFQVLTAFRAAAPEEIHHHLTRAVDVLDAGRTASVAKFDLTVAIIAEDGAWRLWFSYASALFDAATIERMMEATAYLLVAGSQSPESSVRQLYDEYLASARFRDSGSRGAGRKATRHTVGSIHSGQVGLPADRFSISRVRAATLAVLGWSIVGSGELDLPFEVLRTGDAQIARPSATGPWITCRTTDGIHADDVQIQVPDDGRYDLESVDVITGLVLAVLDTPDPAMLQIDLPSPGLVAEQRDVAGRNVDDLTDLWLDYADTADSVDPAVPLVGTDARWRVGRSVAHADSAAGHPARVAAVSATVGALASAGVLAPDALIAEGTIVDVDEPSREGMCRFVVGRARRTFPVLITWRSDAGELDDVSRTALSMSGDEAEGFLILRDHSPSTIGVFDDLPDAQVAVRIHHSDSHTPPTCDPDDDHCVIVDVIVARTQERAVPVTVRVTTTLAVEVQDLAERIALDIAATGISAGDPAVLDPRVAGVVSEQRAGTELVAVDAQVTAELSATFGAIAEILPVSPLQEGLLFHLLSASAAESTDVYSSQFVIDFTGPVDPARFHAATTALLYRYPNLRAGFHLDGDSTYQVIAGRVVAPWTFYREEETTRVGRTAILHDERRRPFAADAPPLIRFALLQHDSEHWTLSVVFEHLLMDGWSSGLMLQALFALYDDIDVAADAVPEHTVAAEPAFRDYLQWLASRDIAQGYSVWTRELAGIESPTLIRPGATEPARAVHARDHDIDIDDSLAAALRTLAAEAGVTLASVLYTAWGVLLSKLVGSDDVVFGTVASGRSADLEDSDQIIGLLFNTVPVRTTVQPGVSIREHLRAQQRSQLETIDHPYVQLSQLHSALGVDQLFDTLFVLQNHQWTDTDSSRIGPHGSITIDDVALMDSTHYPVSIACHPGDTIHLRCAYRSDLISPDEVVALMARFVSVLQGFVADPGAPMARISVLSDAEAVAGVTAELVARPIPQETIASLLARQVATHPQRIALVSGDVRLTFSEMSTQVRAMAAELIRCGIGPEDRVALFLRRDHRMAIAMFAVFEIGAAYVPIDTELPSARVEYILEDSEASLVCTSGDLVPSLPDSAPAVLRVDDEITPADTGDTVRPVDPDSLAYIIYTSGSTGEPKGVAVPYRGLINMFFNHVERIFRPATEGRGGEPMKIAHTTSFSFDASWEQLFWLLDGHAVYVIDESMRKDPAALLAYYAQNRIDGFDVTPSYGELLVESGLFTPRPESEHGGISLFSLGGEAVPETLWTTLRERPGMWSYNLYGPTEYTINALGANLAESDRPNVGQPIFNTMAMLLDRSMTPVLPGVAGELYVSGVGIGRGYQGRPGQTAAAFVAHPWQAGERMYRTGDLMRRLPDGSLEYLGRSDDQVKIRGFRIEPAEIASVLVARDDVSRATVIVRKETTGKALHAYVVPAGEGVVLEVSDLRDHLAARLPDYMVPSAIGVVEDIPLTVNGKVDARRLPEIDVAHHVVVEPRTETERAIADAVADTLGLSQVSVDADFFGLGGHSLLAMRLAGRLSNTLGRQVSVRAIFDHPTVIGLAAVLDRDVRSDAAAEGSGLPRVGEIERPAQIPASYGQQSLWVIDELAGASPTYTVTVLWHISGELAVDAWTLALRDVVARHEPLRTRLAEAADGAITQIIGPPESVDRWLQIDRIEARGRSDADTITLIEQWGRKPMSVGADSTVRGVIVDRGGNRHVVGMALHHAFVDEGSIGAVSGDLWGAYAERRRGLAPSFEPLPVQFADFAVWQRSMFDSGRFSESARYWTDQLSDAPELSTLPTDFTRPVRQSFRGVDVTIPLERSLMARLRLVTGQLEVSMFMALHAATAVTMNRLGAGSDVVLGSPAGGREDEAVADTVGYLVNTLPIRHRMSPQDTYRAVLTRARNTVLEAFEHQRVPFDQIVAAMHGAHVAGANPLVQVLVSYVAQSADPHERDLLARSGLDPLEPLGGSLGVVKADLDLFFVDDGDGVDANLSYAVDLYEESTIRRFIDTFVKVLEGIVDELDVSLAVAEPLGREYMTHIDPVESAGRVEGRGDAIGTVDALLSSAAAAHGSRTAVVHGAVEWSFAEFDSRVNQVARQLLAVGVRVGDHVAVVGRRDEWLPVMVAAVLRAGGAYLPLDPDQPEDRIAYLLSDSSPAVIVTNSAGWRPPADIETTVVDAVATIDVHDSSIAQQSDSPIDDSHRSRELLIDDAAYLIYTSGTTGRPKGVVVSHRALANRLLWGRETYPLAGGVLAKTPIGFDVSLPELLSPLVEGHPVVVLAAGDHRDPWKIADTLTRRGVERVNFVPSMADVLVENVRADAGARVGEVMLAGEALRWSLAESVESTLGAKVLNIYGPTEAGEVMYFDCAADSGAAREGHVPIGRPVSNSAVAVLDSWLRPVPAGVVGELYLSGAQVARGYHDRFGLTASRFVADPQRCGERLYRTGDLVRSNIHGQLEYVGRADDQIKIRGQRVEPGEVAAILDTHPRVSAAAVIAVDHPVAGKTLVAYVTSSEPDLDPVTFAAHLRDWTGTRLPAHMVPTAFTTLEMLPVTANGKLDRRALPAVDLGGIGGGGRQLSPGTERAVGELVAAVLGLEDVELSADDDFFALGGHSFTAVRLASRIAAEFGVVVGVRHIFENPVLSAVADLVDRSTAHTDADQLRESVVLELSPAQETGNRQHLFCVYPASGSAVMYERLVAHVPEGMAVHGLQNVALFDPDIDMGDLESTARWYYDIVDDVAAGEDIHLLGWSYGAHLAFALAKLIEKHSDSRVLTLTLLDSGPTPEPGFWDRMSIEESIIDFCYAFDIADSKEITSIDELVAHAVHVAPLWPGVSESDVRGMLKSGATATEHLSRPTQGQVHADALLLQASERGNLDTYNWREHIVGKVEYSTTIKGHREMLDDDVVAQWGGRLRRFISGTRQ